VSELAADPHFRSMPLTADASLSSGVTVDYQSFACASTFVESSSSGLRPQRSQARRNICFPLGTPITYAPGSENEIA